jgi:hypothetical protein
MSTDLTNTIWNINNNINAKSFLKKKFSSIVFCDYYNEVDCKKEGVLLQKKGTCLYAIWFWEDYSQESRKQIITGECDSWYYINTGMSYRDIFEEFVDLNYTRL